MPAPSTMDKSEDHWIREAHMWKRVHIHPRNELYIPQQTQYGPDITKLKPERATFMYPQDGTRMTRFDYQWTSQARRMTDKTWTGSTNFEEQTTYKDEYITDEEDNQQAALPAKGIKAPQRREHNLTHLPYRSWCSICVESKGRANNHPTQKTSTVPVIQCDFAYIKRHPWQTSHTSTYSNWRRNRHEHGNNGTRQAKTIHVPDTMPTNISHWVWKNTSHFGTNSSTIRSREIYRVIAEDNSEDNWKQYHSTAITSIQLTIKRGSTEHSSIKWGLSLHNWRATTSSTSSASIVQSCHGW